MEDGLEKGGGMRNWLEVEIWTADLRLDEKASRVSYCYGPVCGEESLIDFVGLSVVVGKKRLRVGVCLSVEHEAHEEQSRSRDCNCVTAMRHDELPT
jgi:hypothetical protein